MKQRNVWLLAAVVLLTACGGAKKKAQERLDRAAHLLAEQRYAEAKLTLDSMRIESPKAFDEIRAGLQLMRRIELEETVRSLAYADSLLALRLVEVEPLKKDFLFEKDTLYQPLGKYVHKLQKLERNVERCYLRSEVDERGDLQISSVYYGKAPLEHAFIRLELPDGTFVESAPVPYDGGNNYRFQHGGFWSEIVTYKGDNRQNLTDFLTRYGDRRIKVTCLGGKRPYVFYLDPQAKQAVAATYELAAALSEIDRLRTEREKAIRRIETLRERIAEKESGEQS